MTGKIHVIVGMSTLSMLCLKCPGGFEMFGTTIYPFIGLFTATAGSYAPDIDLGRTHEGQKHKVASTVISKVGGGHRGITHTLLVPAICLVLMYMTYSKFYYNQMLCSTLMSLLFGWLFGYGMHLVADLFNGKGIPLFWPVFRTKVHVMDIESNGWQAWAWLVVYLALAFFFIFRPNLY